MSKQKLSNIRRTQKVVLDIGTAASEAMSTVFKTTAEQLQKLDNKFNVTSTVREKGVRATEIVKRVDQAHGVSEKTAALGDGIRVRIYKGKSAAVGLAEEAGVTRAVEKSRVLVSRHVSKPAVGLIKKHHLDIRLKAIGRACEELYGSTRGVIKPYFAPKTPDELLRNTSQELRYISACIMQISPDEAQRLANQFGTAVVSKIAGVATSGALLSLVSMFGTAGTGTAIGSLSGAASTSASLAWVGGLLGGGMATGAVLTGGLSIVVGLGAYKTLSSTRRNFDDLDEIEQRIVQYCWMLMAIIDDYLEVSCLEFNADNARKLLNETLLPLDALLRENEVRICSNLDTKNAVAFRQHVLRDFVPVVITPLTEFTESGVADRSLQYQYVIGGVIYALLTSSAVDGSPESQLVLAAIRRSDNDLTNASEVDISSYLSGYDADQLKGISSNVKGIYHELLWVDRYNANHDGTRAELMGSTNYPGADVRIIDVGTGEVVNTVQLKATDSVEYVQKHQARYEDVEIFTTSEVAEKASDVRSSEFGNRDLTEKVDGDLGSVEDNTVGDRVLEGAGYAVSVATGQELLEMLLGKKEFPEAVTNTLKKTGSTAAATAVTAYLFS